LSAAISPKQSIQEVNKEEGKDLEMEDALNEEERNQIKEDRINTRERKPTWRLIKSQESSSLICGSNLSNPMCGVNLP